MVSPVLSEGYATAGFLVSEMPGTLSRDVAIFDNTGGALDLVLNAGTVYSVSAFGTPTSVATGGNVGNGTFGGFTTVPGQAIVGAYTLTMTSATTFALVAPDGRQLAPGKTATAYSDGIGFTLTAGGTAFAAGDSFTITVPAGTGYIVAYTGASPAAGIVYNRAVIPALGTKVVTTILRNAEVNLSDLQWATGVTNAQQTAALAQLRLLGVIARA